MKKTILAILLINSLGYARNPTYTEDIQAIFKNRCSRCHDYMAGKNWQKYEEAYNFRLQIKQKVYTKEMPAGTNDMPQSERDLIINWVDTGAAK